MTNDREPGRPRRVWFRLVPHGEDAPHHILVDGNPERLGHLLRDPRTAPGRVPLFHVGEGGHDFLGRSLARLLPLLGREQKPTFPLRQRSMEAQQRGGFQNDRGTNQPAWAYEERADADEPSDQRGRDLVNVSGND
jgi:hypothetical protein